MQSVELQVQIAQTRAFIDADKEILTVTNPATKDSDGAGGWNTTPAVDVQVECRMIRQNDRLPMAKDSNGDRLRVEYMLIAMPDAPIQRYATFDWDGNKYRVEMIHSKPDYELKAEVIIDG